MKNPLEPMKLYGEIQPFVEQDIKRMTDKYLEKDKYQTANIQAHTHNGVDSQKFSQSNLSDSVNYLAIQSVTLTPTQVKALNSTPFTLIPAPVVGNLYGSQTPKVVIIVKDITARINYAGTAYTGANALEFRYTDAAGAKVTADISTTFLNAAASAYVHVSGVITELVPVANSPIIVRVPTANPGTGNSPITFTLHYMTVPFQS